MRRRCSSVYFNGWKMPMRHEFNHSRRQAQRMGGIHRIIDDDLSMIIINISPYLELSLFHRSNPTRRAKQQIQFMSEKCTSKSGGGGLRKKHFAQLVTCQRDLWHRSSTSKAATRMNLFYYRAEVTPAGVLQWKKRSRFLQKSSANSCLHKQIG